LQQGQKNKRKFARGEELNRFRKDLWNFGENILGIELSSVQFDVLVGTAMLNSDNEKETLDEFAKLLELLSYFAGSKRR